MRCARSAGIGMWRQSLCLKICTTLTSHLYQLLCCRRSRQDSLTKCVGPFKRFPIGRSSYQGWLGSWQCAKNGFTGLHSRG